MITHVVIPVPACAGINLRAGTQTGQVARDINACIPVHRLGLGSRLRGDDSTEMRIGFSLRSLLK
jgi:hypothetical protein